jgi:hypothetical protein
VGGKTLSYSRQPLHPQYVPAPANGVQTKMPIRSYHHNVKYHHRCRHNSGRFHGRHHLQSIVSEIQSTDFTTKSSLSNSLDGSVITEHTATRSSPSCLCQTELRQAHALTGAHRRRAPPEVKLHNAVSLDESGTACPPRSPDGMYRQEECVDPSATRTPARQTRQRRLHLPGKINVQ